MNIFTKINNKANQIYSDYISPKIEYNREKNISKSNPTSRIYYTGFPSSIEDPWVKNFLMNIFLPQKYQTSRISIYDPDIQYFSVFQKRNLIIKSKAKNKIFWTGEDVINNYTDFSDHCLNESSLSIGFLPENEIPENLRYKYIRFPLWLLFYFINTPDNTIPTKDYINSIVKKINQTQYIKTNFCALVAGHDRNGIRGYLKSQLSDISEVKSAGSYLHNDDSLTKKYNNNKIEYLKSFMFNICPENTSTNGYVTEKLFQSFDAGCIPIYNGGGNYIEPEVINPNAIIYFTPEKSDQVINQVKELWQNPKYYSEFIKQPKLLDSSTDYIFNLIQEAKEKFLLNIH